MMTIFEERTDRITVNTPATHRVTGTISIDINTPISIGSSAARVYAADLAVIFRDSQFNGITCREASLTNVGDVDGWFRMTLNIPFYWDGIYSPPFSLQLTVPESVAIVQAMTVTPAADRQSLIDNLVRALMDAGVWDKLDILYIQAAHDAQAALINWVDPGPYDGIPMGGIAFITDYGYDPVGGIGNDDYIDCGSARWGELAHHGGTSTHMGLWSQSTESSNFPCIGSDTQLVGGDIMNNKLIAYSSGSIRGTHNSNSNFAVAVASGVGHAVTNRNGTTSHQVYKNGELAGSPNTTYNKVTVSNINLMRNDAQGTTSRSQSITHIGSSLTSTEVADMYAAFNAYMSGL